jgi:hypothetical protein
MNDKTKKPSATADSAKPPKKLTPRTAPKTETKPVATEQAVAETQTQPSTPATTKTVVKAPAKPRTRAPRQPSEVEQTVAKHQKVLADALVKAQAIKYDQPKVMAPETQKDKKAGKGEKPAKAKKIKLVRDSYAMPENEHARIGELKKRMTALGDSVKKSELLRAGIALLAALNDAELKAVMGRVERIKTGRPSK